MQVLRVAAGLGAEGAEAMEMPWAQAAHGMPAMLRCTDLLGQCSFVNTAWQEFTGLTTEHASGRLWEAAVHPDDLAGCRKALEQALAEQRPFRQEYRLRRADGSWRGVVEEGRPLFHAGQLAHLLAQCIDITEIQALAERRRMRDEREDLVREFQHRVRNNAQATSSVLNLQAGRSQDPVVAAALRGAAARVLLATQVQDRMFLMAGSATVELGPELIAAAQAACDLAGQHRARLHCVVAAGVALPVRRAAPLALIVNELVTNALHHAFPPGSDGVVSVTLHRVSAVEAELAVTDDGIGIADPGGIGIADPGGIGIADPGGIGIADPGEISLPGPSEIATSARASSERGGGLGLHLARRLASQAGSRLLVEAAAEGGGGGTRLRLRFVAPGGATPLSDT
jgi:PAS domain S-box-containing protein